MVVLNLHTNKSGLFDKATLSPRGGLEKVIIDLHTMFNENGITCYSICSVEDERIDDRYLQLNPPKNSNIWGSDKYFKMYIDSIVSKIIELGVTHVIVHGAIRIAKHFSIRKIPYLFIDHQSELAINKLYHGEFFGEIVPESKKVGSRICTVSNNNKLMLERQVVLQKMADNFEYDGVIKLQYYSEDFDKYKNKGNGRIITIGRSALDKSPHYALSVSRKTKTPLDIITTLPKNPPDKDVAYYDKFLKGVPEVLLNISRTTTMEMLSNASIYISTCAKESAGITAFEALSCGVPVLILSEKQNHSSTEFLENGSKYITIMPQKRIDLDKFNEMMNYSLEERLLIKESAKEFNKKIYVLDNIKSELTKIPEIKLVNNLLI